MPETITSNGITATRNSSTGSWVISRNAQANIPQITLNSTNTREILRAVEIIAAAPPNLRTALTSYYNTNQVINFDLTLNDTPGESGHSAFVGPTATNLYVGVNPQLAGNTKTSINIVISRSSFYDYKPDDPKARFLDAKFTEFVIHELLHPYVGPHIWTKYNPNAKKPYYNDRTDANVAADPTSNLTFEDLLSLGITPSGASGTGAQLLASYRARVKSFMAISMDRNGANNKLLLSKIIYTREDSSKYQAASQLGAAIGSTIGRYLVNDNVVASTVAGSAFATIGQNLGQLLATNGLSGKITNLAGQTVSVLDNFGHELGTNLKNAAVGAVSSALFMELGRTLGVKGFGAELLSNTGSTVLGKVLDNLVTNPSGNLFSGFDKTGLFGKTTNGVAQGGLLPGAIGSFLGSKLGSLMLAPTNTEGAILSSLGATGGVIALTTGASALGIGSFTTALSQFFGGIANIGVPFVGSLVGYLLGSLIGRLFGTKKPRVPTASAETFLDLASGRWSLGATTSANGGNVDFANAMANSAVAAVNGLVNYVVGGSDLNATGNAVALREKFGHQGSTVYFDWYSSGSWTRTYSGSDSSVATEMGISYALRETRIRGGDFLIKRLVTAQPNASLTTLLGNVQVAEDYRKYLVNAANINGAIAADPSSTFAAGWIVTLLQAEELGLNRFAPSDFYGGLQGFSESFGFGRTNNTLGELASGYENLTVSVEGAALRIATTDSVSPFGLLTGTNNVGAAIAGRSVLIPDFQSAIGYVNWTGQATASNDIWIASGGGPVTMDDMGQHEEWYWNPQDQAWERRYTQVTGGDDIFVGSSYDDALYGRAGWDWLDGGAGQDVAYGGSDDDVMLGRAGADALFGDDGNDYLAGGDGDEHPAHPGSPYNVGLWGGEGNDILVGGGGHDALYGGNGDDLFIVEQDGGGTWDFHSGEAGSDTASFERFNAGVSVDLTTGSGNGYTAITYGDGFLSMENVTGSQFNDVIRGDVGGNVLRGLAGADALYGSDGNDVLEGGADADALVGGGGQDTASYEHSAAWVYVDLQAGITSGGDAVGDTLSSIENLTGSAGNDELTGSVGNNILSGGRGDDVLHMTSGSDVIDGGEGFDTLDANMPVYSGRLLSGTRLLEPNGVLYVGQSVTSSDGLYHLDYQGDGHLVLYGPSGAVWYTDVYGYSPGRAEMRPDGNLAVYDSSGTLKWQSGTFNNAGSQLFLDGSGRLSIRNGGQQLWESRAVADIPPLLYPGEVLRAGQGAFSTDGQYHLDYQGDGHLVLYGPSGAMWSTNVYGYPPGLASMQGDGNLVVYNASGAPVWSSNTWGQIGASLFLSSSGRLTVNSQGGAEVWATGPGAGLTVYHDDYAGGIASINGATTTFSGIEGYIGTAHADYLSGSAVDEVFDGGAANDQLYGGAGSDTYVFGRGDGYDSISDTSSDANAISIRGDVNWRDVAIYGASYWVQNSDLHVQIRGTSDGMVAAANYYFVNSGSNAGNHNHAIKTLDINGLSTIDIDMIDYTPNAADDASTVVYGAQNRADLIFALAGDDTIYAAGNSTAYEIRGNVIYAGDGNDTIFSSAGDDQFIFERGNGTDILTDQGGADTLVMGPSVAADDVIYEVVNTSGSSGDYGSAADLYIGIRDPNNPNATASQVVDRIRVVNGGTKSVGVYSGAETLNTIEHVRVGGQEIDLTKANINWTVSYYYDGGYYPIALDLDGDGIELRSVEGSRITTVEADGTVTRMGWLGQDDGFLALDRDGNGVIDRIGEISFVGDKESAKTDLEGLAAYDSNGDGKLDASDAQLTGFTAADGPDNVVIATTDVVWKDDSRTGSAYDVMLARLQVRTDGGANGLADLDALARGTEVDGIEAKLRGIQALTAEQAVAIKERKARQAYNGESGRFYRAEDLFEGITATVASGLYSIDSELVQAGINAVQKLDLADRFANSEWTKLGSIVLDEGEAEIRGVHALFTEVRLSDAQKAVIENVRKIVADRIIADEAMAVEQVAKDALDSALRPAPTLPTAEEMEKFKREDTFKLLENEADAVASTDDVDDRQMMATEPTASLSQTALPENNASTVNGATDDSGPQDPQSTASQRTVDAEPASLGAAQGSNDSSEVEAYGVVIRAANARLVQALATFGDAPSMMASYQGMNVANDPQAAWLSVDAMPSAQRLAAVR